MAQEAVVILGQVELMALRVSSNLDQLIIHSIIEWVQWPECINHSMVAHIKFQTWPSRNKLNNKQWLKEDLVVLQRIRVNWDLQVQLQQLNRFSKPNITNKPLTKIVLSIIKVSIVWNYLTLFLFLQIWLEPINDNPNLEAMVAVEIKTMLVTIIEWVLQ